MTKDEKKVAIRLLRLLRSQRRIINPILTRADPMDCEVLDLLDLLWEWTPSPRYDIPSKHKIEKLVACMRGLTGGWAYISASDVARIIKDQAQKRLRGEEGKRLQVYLTQKSYGMEGLDFYYNAKWNYKPTEYIDLFLEEYRKITNNKD